MSPAVALQYLLPHRLLSRLAYAAARWTWTPWKNLLIRTVVSRFDVDMSEFAEREPTAHPSFNAFFTRGLRPGARSDDPDPDALVMPCDGVISQLGPIESGRIFQAKGHGFSAAQLLGDEAAAAPFANGSFATVYLSPRDYHRVHMPFAGTLRETLHVPGRIFSVAPFAVQAIPGLFARNERLVCHFDTAFGPMAVVLVGAILVSGVETVWGGEEIPPYADRPRHRDWRGQDVRLDRFAEMGRFNYGSTVIVLVPPGVRMDEHWLPEQVVRLGQRLGMVGG
ncbi:archaetidylserine decarboxylase [Coralloluteibacterium stylophorae]|uniref:Phosphatidylserine decarboxylase proenzyme n=1 Tax=Coralloluteibacterium stylophorae TaxID=1776034 RepID=A0A8J7VW72_9GAMM|nr:archaetidylserine decarboxylase [Coralloluteibacterium stylophorae]MBS7457622.1 phosphatidylserine decarboxylase [Coralloluteibacterium stylophorae]